MSPKSTPNDAAKTRSGRVPRSRQAAARTAAPRVQKRVSEQVFESIARSILAGELAPGEALPTHRVLAKQFDASPVLVRQAIHRLEEIGLVRVRHGSGSVVLDPDESTDIRMLQLRIELAPPSLDVAATVLEVQSLGVVSILLLAERRIDAAQLARLEQLVEALPAEPSAAQVRRFVLAYWQVVARAANNSWLEQQVRWWMRLRTELRRRHRDVPLPGAPELVRAVYRRLTKALAARHGAVQVYCEAITPLLNWLDARHTLAAASR